MNLSRTARSAAASGGLRSLTRSSTRTTGSQAIKAAISISGKCTGCQRRGFGGKSGRFRHCERSEAIQCCAAVLDCFVASLLAMTDKNRGGFVDGNHPAGSRLCRRAARRDAGRCRGRRCRLRDGARGVRGSFGAAVSRRFGPPETTKVGSLGTGTNFVILTTIGDDGKVVPEDHRYAMRNKANQLWHTDSSFKAVPALTSVLAARTIPDHGGETEFASTRLAFERLDPALQKKFENSFAWHHYGHSRAKVAAGLATPEELDALPPRCWRLVWRNPVNGRGALYIASHTYAIEGMERAAGEQLIEELTAAATAPGTTYQHKWKSGDVIMWDNRATMHRGRPWPGNEPRYMVRTTISATAADGVETMRPPSLQAAE